MSEPDVDLTRDYFELFGLPPSFEVDSEALSVRYRDLQRAVHPDRFAAGEERARREAVQKASYVNEGFRVLKSPLARARYLLELKGIHFNEADTTMDPTFLMEQMELREALAGVRDADDPFAALARVRQDLEAREREMHEELRAHFAQDTDESLERAREDVRKMQFLQKLLDEASALEEDLTHAL